MNKCFVRIIEPHEIDAVELGHIEGDIYKDGEVWAETQSLTAFPALVAQRPQNSTDA